MTATVRPDHRARPGVRDYAKLAKLSFYDYYLCVLVVDTMLASARLDARTVLVLALFDLGWVGVVAATVTFDDVTGYRDGSDQRNYSPDQGALRNRDRKPLLDGHITVGQAVRFGYASAAWGALLWALAIAVAPHRPAWALVAAPVALLISVQYSYGLRLSYRGGQELVILVSTALCVAVPYGLLSGRASGIAVLESYLFGLWSLLVSVYSNVNDVEGDRAANRFNLATRTSPGTYRAFIAVLTATETAAALVAAVLGAVPWWFLAFLVPVVGLRARQLHAGLVAGDPLVARRLGIRIHRTGVAVLLLANVLVVHFR